MDAVYGQSAPEESAAMAAAIAASATSWRPCKRKLSRSIIYEGTFAVYERLRYARCMTVETETAPSSVTALAADIRVLVGRLRRQMLERSDLGDLTSTQSAVIVRLEASGPATVSSLARAEGLRPQSMGPHLTALERSGYVDKAPDPNDGRQSVYTLTKAGAERIRAGRAAREDWLSRAIERNFAAAEHEELARAAAMLARLLDR